MCFPEKAGEVYLLVQGNTTGNLVLANCPLTAVLLCASSASVGKILSSGQELSLHADTLALDNPAISAQLRLALADTGRRDYPFLHL